jgi:putative aldouronate transport system substrate-binding protein
MPAFFHYPANPRRLFDSPPGKGGTVSALVPALTAQLLNPSANGHWQAINERVGATLKISGNNGPAYLQMVQTAIAGGEIPDIMQVTGTAQLPDLPQLLRAKFTDLTEYLSGDAVSDYPSLAAIPSYSWATAIVDGAVYGLPATQPIAPVNVIIRRDMFDEFGVDPACASGKDLMSVSQAMTRPQKNCWAWGQDPASVLVPIAQQMLGVPNQWAKSDGRFVNSAEAPETKQAIDFVTQMWKNGVIHPDAIASPVQYPTWFAGKTISMTTGALGSWKLRILSLMSEGLPGVTCDGLLLPQFDGGGVARYWMGKSTRGLTALKKASPDRIRELLAIMDWMAAPFGTDEYLVNTYGVEGINYTLDGTDPVPITDHEETLNWVNFLTRCAEPLYFPGQVDVVKRQYELQQQQIPTASANPADSLFSGTQLKLGAKLDKLLRDGMTDIITARKPLSSWDAIVRQWRDGGGAAIAKELAASEANSS